MQAPSDRLSRPVRPEEIEHIAEMAAQAWEPVYASFRRLLGAEVFEALHANWRERKADQVRQAARTRPDCVYVTEVAGRVVGFTTFSLDTARGIGEIGNNAVAPACQGMGIGTFQHQQVLGIFRQRGLRIAKVTTGADESHAPARRSYEKAGFDRSLSSMTYCMRL